MGWKPCCICKTPVFSRNGGAKTCGPKCYYTVHSIKNRVGCWGWSGRKNGDGYGRVRLKTGQSVGAHRIAYELFIGPIPKGLLVLHECDNPPCTNPKHLFLGTDLTNAQDASRKNRNRKSRNVGSKNPNSSLTEEMVKKIKKMKGLQKDIAEYFNVSKASVCLIKNGKAWKHVRT